MEQHHDTTLLQLINRQLMTGKFGYTRSIAEVLGLSEEEFAAAEQDGFTEEQTLQIKQEVNELRLRLRKENLT